MSRTVSISSADALFKDLYGSGKDQSLVNKKTPLASVLMKNKKADWVGKRFVQPVRFGSAVGLGYRAAGQNLPEPEAAPRDSAVFPAKRAYATAEYDREAIVASRNDKGAFAKVTVDETEATEEGFMLHMLERALFGDSSGVLGEVESVTGAGTEASPWAIVLEDDMGAAPKPKKKYFPRNAKLDLFTQAGVYGLTVKVTGYTSSTKVLTAITVATGSVATPVAQDQIYWNGNRNGECVGLRNFTPAAAGTLYGISQTTNPEFRGTLNDLGGGTIVYDDLNDIVATMEDEIDSPNMAFCSATTMAGLKNQSEDHKRYPVAEAKSSNAKIGFKGLELMTAEGPIPLLSSQMCQDEDIHFINTNYMQIVMRSSDFGWFDEDGKILARHPNKDVYNARYGGYFELFCSKPNSVGRITNFLVG